MPTVFLIGGTGYIGSYAAAALRRAGHDVTALVRDAAKPEAIALQLVRDVWRTWAAVYDSACFGAMRQPGSREDDGGHGFAGDAMGCHA